MNTRLGSLTFIPMEVDIPGGIFFEGGGEDSYGVLKHQLQGYCNNLPQRCNHKGLN